MNYKMGKFKFLKAFTIRIFHVIVKKPQVICQWFWFRLGFLPF